MSSTLTPGLPTRRNFGIGYLAGIGVLLAAGLLGNGLASDEPIFVGLVSAGVAVPLFGAILYVDYTFRELDISEDLVWTVAQWTALGVAFATLLSLVAGLAYRYVPDVDVVPGLLVVTIVSGGLVGALLGATFGLREQHLRLSDLTQRNAVLNRVLRHNIKNDMNVIIGHAALLEQEVDGTKARSVDAIQRAATDVTRLSESARTIDELGTRPETTRIDVTRVVRQCVDSTASFYPDAELSTDLPPAASIEVSPIFGSVVTNLLENAVEHNDGDPTVHVAVGLAGDDDERVHLSVADDGPGIYEHERAVFDRAEEEAMYHGSGMGLWLVKWFVDAHDGELWFEDDESGGTVVHLSLPAADGQRDGGG